MLSIRRDEQSEQVERRLVGPVHVFQHEDGRRTELPRQHRHDLVRHHSARDDVGKLAADLFRDREQRPERARGEERIATAPEDALGRSERLTEPAQERGLADACLTTQKDKPALLARPDRGERFRERRQSALALEETVGRAGKSGVVRDHRLVQETHQQVEILQDDTPRGTWRTVSARGRESADEEAVQLTELVRDSEGSGAVSRVRAVTSR